MVWPRSFAHQREGNSGTLEVRHGGLRNTTRRPPRM